MATPIPVKKKGRKSKRPNQYEFELNYYTLDRSAEDLARKYDVKVNTIYQWARQFREQKTTPLTKEQFKNLFRPELARRGGTKHKILI